MIRTGWNDRTGWSDRTGGVIEQDEIEQDGMIEQVE
jgi:hypothetical protein